MWGKVVAKKPLHPPKRDAGLAGAGENTWDPVLVSHATFILGTSLALLAGLLLGLVLGARLGHGHRVRGGGADLTAACRGSIIGACSQGTARGTPSSRAMYVSLARGGPACAV